jgi:hypothetical protein
MLAHLHVVTLCADEGNFPSAGSCLCLVAAACFLLLFPGCVDILAPDKSSSVLSTSARQKPDPDSD